MAWCPRWVAWFLYLPDTPLHHRMVSLMASAFAMIACYTLGIISHLLPAGMLLALATVAMLSNMTCRFYQVNPPGSLFFSWRRRLARILRSSCCKHHSRWACWRWAVCWPAWWLLSTACLFCRAACHGRCSLAASQL